MHRLLILAGAALLPAVPAQTPPAAAPAVRLVRPNGLYADLPEVGFSLTSLLAGGGQPPKSFYELRDRIAALAGDATVRTVALDLSGGPVLNLPQIAELARAIDRLRAAGKRCIAYLEQGGLAEYQLAARCDRILLADMGLLDLRSLALSTMFFKDALDLLGVDVDIVRCGDFKGAVEPFVLPRMSDHLRQHYEAMLQSMNQELVMRIATGRKLDPAKVRELQAERLIQAPRARELGLVDALVPWTGAKRAIAADLGVDEAAIGALDERKPKRSFNPMAFLAELFGPKGEKELEEVGIAVLHLSGPIVDGDKAAPGSIVSRPAVATIEKLAGDANVKGVVVRINSPGGSATASEAVLLALRGLAAAKPVTISMGDRAASGGYWITCFGRPIFAEPGTITGSIGVFGMKPSLGALLRRVGVQITTVALDAGARLDAIDEGWSDAQRARMQDLVDRVYDRFLDHVAQSRGLERARVAEIAGGRVWSGAQAVERKLVDAIGGLDAAVAAVAKEAGLPADAPVEHFPRPRTFLDLFAEQFTAVRSLLPAAVRLAADEQDWTGPLLALRAAAGGGVPQVWALADGFRLR
jgi:protease-4